jgi:deoxyribose-phosphate aldolase
MSHENLSQEEIRILSAVDHTLLSQTATWPEIKATCEEGLAYRTASVCIPPSYVKEAAWLLGDRLPVCTVIGFPNGYSTTDVKIFEAGKAIEDGAKEIDMVINIGALKDGHHDRVYSELKAMREATEGFILKVIIETCLLTTEEKITMCRLVTQAGADFIKTSTGFSKGGATLEDIDLFRENVGPNVRIKAAGGISSLEDAREFLAHGASRLGTSRIVKILREQQTDSTAY